MSFQTDAAASGSATYLTKKFHYCYLTKRQKVKEVDLYSAFIVVPHTQGAQVGYGSHSVTCKLHRTCLYLVSIHQMAHSQTGVADI